MPLPFVTITDTIGYLKSADSADSFSTVFVIGPPQEAIIVDLFMASASQEIIAGLEAAGFTPGGVRAMVITHGHEDHFGGASAFRAWCPAAPVWASLHTALQFEDPWGYFASSEAWVSNTSMADWDAFHQRAGEPVRVDRILRDGDEFTHAGMTFSIIAIPGHDRGAIALYERQHRLVFTGDLLQGGMDAPCDWLGLFTETSAQRTSLQRIAALQPEWNFKGHRIPRQGAEVQTDIRCALARLEAMEQAALAALTEASSPLSLAQMTREVLARVLHQASDAPPNYACVTVNALLRDLARRNLVHRDGNLDWMAR